MNGVRTYGTRHRGEIAVRHRAGVPGALDPRLPTVRPELSAQAAMFLMSQRMLIVSVLAPDGKVWVTALTGEPGFIYPVQERLLAVDGSPWTPGDPVVPLLTEGAEVGLISVHFASRSRVRVNGKVVRSAAGRLVVRTEQVYGNCQKYIQARHPEPVSAPRQDTGVTRGHELTEQQAALLRGADTFFLGTGVPGIGADASHRGGMPGFVRVLDNRTIAWPDYPGNRMFMTLGNLQLHPYAGIVVPDWDTGTLLHLSGRGMVTWEDPASRVLELAVDEVVERQAALPLEWSFHGYSPANPPVHEAGV